MRHRDVHIAVHSFGISNDFLQSHLDTLHKIIDSLQRFAPPPNMPQALRDIKAPGIWNLTPVDPPGGHDDATIVGDTVRDSDNVLNNITCFDLFSDDKNDLIDTAAQTIKALIVDASTQTIPNWQDKDLESYEPYAINEDVAMSDAKEIIRVSLDNAQDVHSATVTAGACIDELEVVIDNDVPFSKNLHAVTMREVDDAEVSESKSSCCNSVAPESRIWEVVGGRDTGGVLVRIEQDLKSAEASPSRLSCGSMVKELFLVGTRLKFELISGCGPNTGWVTTKLADKDLLVTCSSDVQPEHTSAEELELAIISHSEPSSPSSSEQVATTESTKRIPAVARFTPRSLVRPPSKFLDRMRAERDFPELPMPSDRSVFQSLGRPLAAEVPLARATVGPMFRVTSAGRLIHGGKQGNKGGIAAWKPPTGAKTPTAFVGKGKGGSLLVPATRQS